MKVLASRVLFVVAGVVLAGTAYTQEKKDQPPVMKPGPEHALLKQMEGTWDASIKMSGPPGAPAMDSKGTMTFKMDLGGFWLVSNFEGQMMGQKFQGHGLSGYDPLQKKYVGVWADSMAPYLLRTEGSWDKAGKVLTEIGEGPDPETGKTEKMKMVTEIKDKDTMLFTMYMPGKDGKDAVMFTIHYKRKK